jgi:hypothetical protein
MVKVLAENDVKYTQETLDPAVLPEGGLGEMFSFALDDLTMLWAQMRPRFHSVASFFAVVCRISPMVRPKRGS